MEKSFINRLAELIDKPPYLVFVFISGVFVFSSIAFNRHFEEIWLFFLYAVAGAIWRYIEKDMLSGIQKVIGHLQKNLEKKEKADVICNLIVISIYHLVNLVLLAWLLIHLELFNFYI